VLLKAQLASGGDGDTCDTIDKVNNLFVGRVLMTIVGRRSVIVWGKKSGTPYPFQNSPIGLKKNPPKSQKVPKST
jgi:hypothetical protein